MRRIFTGLAMASFMMLGISSAAYANYDPQLPATCDGGNNVPDSTFTGGVISSIGGCNLSESITASSAVSVTSDGAVNVTGSLSAPGVTVQSTGSTVSVGAITSSAFIDILAHDANNTVYNSININGSISAALATNIVGSNITSAVPLTSAGITSHGGGTVNLVALNGDVDVTNDSGDINVVGNVGDSTTTTVYISAGDAIGNGNINISGTVSTTSAQFTNVELVAGGNISTGAITSPQIHVYANDYGITGTSTFLLGGGGTNGISGAVTANNTTGGGGYIDIENGYQTGQGNITVTDGKVVATGTDGNFIDISALGGTLILPGGPITAGGPDSQIVLAGKTVNFVNGTNISSDYLTGGLTHSVVIEADTINYAGTSVVTANGSGQDSNDPGAVLVQGYTSGTTKVQFIGAAGAQISLGADGDHTYTQVYADAISFATGAVTLHSQGTTDHSVYLTNVDDTSTSDNLTVTSGSLLADASGKAGAGGTVSVDVYAAVLNGDSITLNANGPATGDGNGGTINFNANSTVMGATSKGLLTANAAATGNGAASTSAISFYPGSDVVLGSANGEFALSANGGNVSGNAGSITVNSGSGTVTVDVPTTQPTTVVSAIATGSSGLGGNVSINKYSTRFDINASIKVDASPAESPSNFNGSMTLNGVLCQQYKTGFAPSTWPLVYWDCTSATPDGIQRTFATNYLTTSLQTLMDDSSVTMYTLNSLGDYNSVFKPEKALPLNAVGATFEIPSTPSGYTTVFGLSSNSTRKTELAGHEFGHAIDDANALAGVENSASNDHKKYSINDYLYLDYSNISSTEMASTYRDPCSPGTSPAPFAGVIDLTTNELICNGTTLNPDGNYGNLTNSGILNKADAHIFTANSAGAWAELYAQAFAYADYGYMNIGTVSNLYDQTADGVFYNGYMNCAEKWGAALAGGQSVPPTSASAYCSATLPAWSPGYIPFANKTH